MRSTNKQDIRNEHILSLYKEGMSMNQIGRLYQLTRERVRQILMRYGY